MAEPRPAEPMTGAADPALVNGKSGEAGTEEPSFTIGDAGPTN